MAVLLSEPLEAFVARYLGPPPGRIDDRSSRHWWSCPFHQDGNPSFCVDSGDDHYHCFGCGAHGDAIDFLRRLNPLMTFVEARQAIEERGFAGVTPQKPKPPPRKATPPPPGGWQEFTRQLVRDAENELWSTRGSDARTYLERRCLTAKTIRAARLGVIHEDIRANGIFPDKPLWVPHGIIIPWFEGEDVVMVNVRRPDGSKPKYRAIRGSRRGGAYPSRKVIAAGKPVAIVEGEFEPILLNQELVGLIPAVTFGSAGDRPRGRAIDSLLSASPWYIATDADAAGIKSAEAWRETSDRSRRVCPPGAFKDWTEMAQAGVGLRRWWSDILTGNPSPPLFTWEELSRQRWGPATEDKTPGIDIPDDWR